MGIIYGYAGLAIEEDNQAKDGYVYFIRDGMGNIKIGVAKDVLKRKQELQTSNPHELEIFYCMHVQDYYDAQRIEKEMHKKFASSRIRGEWFKEPEILEYLRNGEIDVCDFLFENATW